jgi:hypothetical protein
MVAQTPSWLRIAAFLAAAGCVGGGSLQRAVQVETGQRTTVQLVQFGDGPSVAGKALSLQNASSLTAPAGTSPATPPDPLTKVVDDEQLQRLLDVFAENGVFANGLPNAAPDAQDALVVSHGGKRWVFSRRKVGLQQEELAFHQAKASFLVVWNSATAYRGTGKERPDFRAAQKNLPKPGSGK